MINNKKAFTLVEILVVVAILLILGKIIIPATIRHIDRAKEAKTEKELQSLYASVMMYYNKNSSYPKVWDDLDSYIDIKRYKQNYEINNNL